jgi:hypothetical protein
LIAVEAVASGGMIYAPPVSRRDRGAAESGLTKGLRGGRFTVGKRPCRAPAGISAMGQNRTSALQKGFWERLTKRRTRCPTRISKVRSRVSAIPREGGSDGYPDSFKLRLINIWSYVSMVEFLASIIGALAAGAVAKAGETGGRVIADAYDGLKALIVRKLGKGGAVQSVEDEPRSETAQAALIEARSPRRVSQPTLNSHSAPRPFAPRSSAPLGRAARKSKWATSSAR